MNAKKKSRRLSVLLLCVMLLCACMISLVGCVDDTASSSDGISGSSGSVNPGEDESDGLTMLKTDGEFIRDQGGEGDVVWLRGVNAGGLGVIELWMTGFSNASGCGDHKTTTLKFIERFGEEKAQELWKEYQSNWWTDEDFQNCADMGMTSIRLPFTYMNVDFAAVQGLQYGGESYDFTMLDEFVAKAAEYGMYTILDLHGAYGSQNGQDHSGEIQQAADVDFYSNEQKMSLTIDLWRAIAEHFKDNPNVAAYDILNEPGERNEGSGTQSTTTRHWNFMDRVYDAIREVDENHIVVFESCWEGNNLPHPNVYGWENCMYSFHHYSNTTNYQQHTSSVDNKIANVAAQNFGIPVQMGEFTCYENEQSWEYTLDLLNRSNWHWVSWTYKINNDWTDSTWGIYHIDYSENGEENWASTANAYKVDAAKDSEEEMKEKWARIRTEEHGEKYTFASGTTLYDIIKKYCTQSLETEGTQDAEVEDGNYILFNAAQSGQGVSVSGSLGGTQTLCVKDNVADMLEIVNLPSGHVNIRNRGKNIGVFNYNGTVYVGVTDRDTAAEEFSVKKTAKGEFLLISVSTGRYLCYEAETGYVRADELGVEGALKLHLN